MWLILGPGKGNLLKDANRDVTDINITSYVRKYMLVYYSIIMNSGLGVYLSCATIFSLLSFSSLVFVPCLSLSHEHSTQQSSFWTHMSGGQLSLVALGVPWVVRRP